MFNAFNWIHNESARAEDCCCASLCGLKFFKAYFSLATIKSVMSQQVFSIIRQRKKKPHCDITDWGVVRKYNMLDSFYDSCVVVCSLAVHRVQLLYTVSWVYCGTQLSFSQRQNSQTIVVALNIRWNLIHLKSQGNQSLLGAEWLSSLQPLTGRDVTSQERS